MSWTCEIHFQDEIVHQRLQALSVALILCHRHQVWSIPLGLSPLLSNETDFGSLFQSKFLSRHLTIVVAFAFAITFQPASRKTPKEYRWIIGSILCVCRFVCFVWFFFSIRQRLNHFVSTCLTEGGTWCAACSLRWLLFLALLHVAVDDKRIQDAYAKLIKGETEMQAELSIGSLCCYDR